ncbi:MAG: MFS transporter [Anaerolineales bacterium]
MTDMPDETLPLDPDGQPTQFEKMRTIPWSLAYDLANTFFIQLSFFGSVFVLFLDELGLNELQIGILLSIMPFLSLLSLVLAKPAAKIGYRRTFLVSMMARTLFTAGLLLVPWLASQFDVDFIGRFVMLVILAFAISRAVTNTAYLPWQQEYIPQQMRGRYSGYSNVIINVAGLIAISVAGFLLNSPLGIGRYALLFGIGVGFSLLCIYLASHFPGGAPSRDKLSLFQIDNKTFAPLRDKRFLQYLVTLGLITLAMGPISSFLPIFMKNKVGLNLGSIAILQTGSLIGSLLSSYFWGWLADRYGSKPISLTGLLMTVILPVFWFVMPRGTYLSFPIALSIAFLQGIAGTGWNIGTDRLLFVTIASSEHRREYLAQFSAWTGLLSGTGAILGGVLLQRFSSTQWTVLTVSVDSYSLLFAIGFILLSCAILILASVRVPQETSLGEFASLFLRGNPWSAISSMIRFNYAKEEAEMLSATRRLGLTRSPLTVEELIRSLNDPRFYVRFEAIVSMTQQRSNERLVQALVDVLEAPDPALSVIAAWALGRIGNESALPALRKAFQNAGYRSIQAHAARALGSLQDKQSIPLLMKYVQGDADLGIKVACASSLGKLRVKEATPYLLEVLYMDRYLQSRREMGLSLARILDAEGKYIQLSRKVNEDAGTALAQEMETLRSTIRDFSLNINLLIDAQEQFARAQLDVGFKFLLSIMDDIGVKVTQNYCKQILNECNVRVREFGQMRMEYPILSIVTMEKCAE